MPRFLRISAFLCLSPFLLSFASVQPEQEHYSILETFLEFLLRGQKDTDLENQDNGIPLLKEYDFIVVGAGTAGCTLAARLSENPKWRVLLLEAGGPENLVMDIPILTHFLQLGDINWKYRTQPSNQACLAMNGNRCNWPRGKVMGGSSVLNYMMYTRGNRRDYDRWSELGNEGWSYQDVLPYFKKYEGSTIPDAEKEYVGRNGPVKVSYIDWRTKIADAFVNASQQDGLKLRDYNGRVQTGVSYLQTNTYKSTRWSANRAYLYPLKNPNHRRANLHIKKYAMVTKILINGSTKTAYGVAFSSGGRSFEVHAKREVIISAGAINTPQLLMLSGIGPAQHLREMGIKHVIADLAVGFNLQDHIAPAVSFLTNITSLRFESFFNTKFFDDFVHGNGPYGIPGGCETISFYDLDHPELEDGWPDVELFLISGSMHANPALNRAIGFKLSVYTAMFSDMEKNQLDGFLIFPMILRPKSRGRIMLKSTDPFKHPLIYPNYLTHPYDMDVLVRGILKAIELIEQPAFKKINAQLLDKILPTCSQYPYKSRPYWECYVRHFTLTIYHYSGTAKMGPASDRAAVVDPRLRVYGVQNLRVADASIMPHLIAGHPNGPIYMIAEKAADMIKEDHNHMKEFQHTKK